MVKLADILSGRLKTKDKAKTTALAVATTQGDRSSFAGVFGVAQPKEEDKEKLALILTEYATGEDHDNREDVQALAAITAEVRAITNQAAILHGERIKRAQLILKRYKEGAFTAWLLAAYGNRQTPYNFLAYYEFYNKTPKDLHPQIEAMPRQAIYTLASREGEQEKKEELVRNYRGETKEELISLIRTLFPLREKDKRRENVGEQVQTALAKMMRLLKMRRVNIEPNQRNQLNAMLDELRRLLNQCEEK